MPLAEAPWIEDAPRAEIERLFVWTSGAEAAIPPPPRRGHDYPSVLLLEQPREAYSDADIRLLARFARQLTVASDRMSARRHGPFTRFRPDAGGWLVDRLTWHQPRRVPTVEEGVALLARGTGAMDLDPQDAGFAGFDAEHGHPWPSGPAC